jgi:ethanolamine transporter EutH
MYFCNLPGSFAPQTSLVLVLVFVLCVRLAAGNWTGFGAVIRSFERPIRAAVGLIGLGLVLAFLPYFLFSLLPPGKHALPLEYFLRNPHSTNDISGLLYSAFQMGLFARHFAMPPAGVLSAQAALIVVLVLTMVVLARRGLRRIPPSDGALLNRATSGSR